MELIKNLLKGMVIGVSNVIPGVSGGTMAVVFGIYDKLISSVTNFFKDVKRNIVFLGSLAIGAGVGILLFTKLIQFLLDNYNQQTNFFFIGLILGTCPLLWKKATEKEVKPTNYMWLIVAFIIVLAMGLMGDPESKNAIITEVTWGSGIKLLLAGFVAAATMILPGVSGSFILLLLGLYDTVIQAISAFNIPIIFVVGVGVILGFLTMTKIIETLFNKYPQTAYFTILGLVAGSIFAIWPGFTLNLYGVLSIVILFIGFSIAYVIGAYESK